MPGSINVFASNVNKSIKTLTDIISIQQKTLVFLTEEVKQLKLKLKEHKSDVVHHRGIQNVER